MLHPPPIISDDRARRTAGRASSPPIGRRDRLDGHRDWLDGIRGLAALWVALSHLWIIPCGLAAQDGWLGFWTNWTLYSHFAVDIFLVLSGFCLMLPVARDGRLEGGAGPFFWRRGRRILPPYYAALVFSVFISLIIQALDRQPLQVSLPAVLANVFLVQDLRLDLNSFNGPFWSIAVEWRIYLLFPALVWVLRRYGGRGALAFALLIGGALTVFLQRLHPEMWMACPWYLLLFTLGLCAGRASARRPSRDEPFLCAVGGGLSFAVLAGLVHAHPITAAGGADFGAWLPLSDTLAGVSAAAALLGFSRLPQRVPLLSWRPLALLGTFAYSLYLVHLPCLLLLNTLVSLWEPSWQNPLLHAAVLLCLLPAIILMARLFFLAFEKPFIRRGPFRDPDAGRE